MQDGFDKKRQMVKVLMDMLKHNASDEVQHGMTDLSKPHAAQMQPASDSSKMADGGMAALTDEPEEVHPADLPSEDVTNPALANLPTTPDDEEAEKEEMQTEHDDNILYEDQDNNSSAFDAFLPRKKKK